MIAITGASGGLGFSTLTALAAHPVVAIVRNRARLETRLRTTPEISISPQTVIRQADWFLSQLDGIRQQEFSVVSDTLATLLNRTPQT